MARRLLLLNGLAILGVILNHSAAWGFISMFWWTDRYLPVAVPNFDQLGGFAYYVLRFVEQLVGYSVPAFLFVSGFFIAFAAGRSKTAVAWRIIGIRMKTLLIPFVIWSIMIFIGWALQGNILTIPEYVRIIILGKATPAYYFIPLLGQLFLLSPLVFLPAARTRWKLLLVITAVVQISVQAARYPYILGIDVPFLNWLVDVTPNVFFPGKMFWFVFGIVTTLRLPQIGPWLGPNRRRFLVATIVLLPLGMIEWELLLHYHAREWLAYYDTALDSFYAAFFILTFLAYNQISIPLSTRLADVGTKSYGIYLVHSPVLEYVSRLVYHAAPWIMGYQILLFQPILILFGFGIPLGLMAAVKRSPARKLFPYLFG